VNQTKFFRTETTEQFDGVNMTAYIQRDSLPIGRQAADGSIRPDYTSIKYITEVWPVINGTVGGVVNIYIGTRRHKGDTVSWKGPYPFTIGSDRKVNVRASGAIIDIKFESDTNIEWSMPSFAINVHVGGVR
jgi:hypothetical protein